MDENLINQMQQSVKLLEFYERVNQTETNSDDALTCIRDAAVSICGELLATKDYKLYNSFFQFNYQLPQNYLGAFKDYMSKLIEYELKLHSYSIRLQIVKAFFEHLFVEMIKANMSVLDAQGIFGNAGVEYKASTYEGQFLNWFAFAYDFMKVLCDDDSDENSEAEEKGE